MRPELPKQPVEGIAGGRLMHSAAVGRRHRSLFALDRMEIVPNQGGLHEQTLSSAGCGESLDDGVC
jgi:hypothetical protein